MTLPRRIAAAPLARFVVVGGTGFAVDAGILQVLVLAGVDPLWARGASFPVALAVTALLNRAWTFAGPRARRGRGLRLFGAYAAVQVAGQGVNLAVYAALLGLLPPVAALAAGSLAAIAVTFTGARCVFTVSPRSTHPV